MPNLLWKITLRNQHNATYTCTLMDIADAPALKRLEIKSEANEAFIAIVELTPEAVYIKEVALQGEHFGFRKENGMLVPAKPKTGDTWQVSTEKKKKRVVRILFNMEGTVVAAEPQRLVLSVDIDVNVRSPIKKVNETVAAVVSINPNADCQIQRVQLPNGDIYENSDVKPESPLDLGI